MVILIGGSSHTGKTYLAQRLLEELHFPYVSLDHLKMGFIRSGMTELTVEDDDEMREFLWPFAAEIVNTAIENSQNLIMEGCYIPGNWRDYIPKPYLKDVYCIFLVMSEEYLRAHINTVSEKAGVIEKRILDEVDMERLIACSKYFKEECVLRNIPYYEIDQVFDIEDIARTVLKGIRETQ